MRTIIIAAIVVLLIIGGGVFALSNKDKVTAPGTTNTTTPAQTETMPSTTPSSTEAAATITYTNNGFSPATTTIKAGQTITIKNDSSISLQFSSNDHPTHLKNPEMNQPAIGPGESQTVTLSNKGTWGYHNHQNPTDTGTVIVQ